MNARFSAIAALRMGLALSLAAAVSLACGGDDITPPVDPPITEPTVESVQISQSDVSFEYFGETVQLSATATDTDGNTMSGVSFSWASSNESVATVSNGRVMARGNGTATITATADNVSGGCSVTVSQVA
ncbi:MAG: hypothetical protein AMS21_12715, partial [Gemmatimonas sp. SG8_38_2]